MRPLTAWQVTPATAATPATTPAAAAAAPANVPANTPGDLPVRIVDPAFSRRGDARLIS